MRNPPAFQCYASDLLALEDFKLASLAERGMIFSMILQCWVNDSVPAGRVDLAKILGLTLADIETALTARTLSFFEDRNGRLVRPELADQKSEMMLRREQQSRGGRKGAKSKWQKGKALMTTPLAVSMTPEKKRADMKRGELRKTEEEHLSEYRRAFGENE